MPSYDDISSQGRYGDTTLMHVSPLEVEGLGELLGRPLPRNPDTGYPEAFAFALPLAMMAAGGIAGGIAGDWKFKNILLGMGLGFAAGAGGSALMGAGGGGTAAAGVAPTIAPTVASTVAPTIAPTVASTVAPTIAPAVAPAVAPVMGSVPPIGGGLATVDPVLAGADLMTAQPMVGSSGGGPMQFMGHAPPGGGLDMAGASQGVSMNPAAADPAAYMDVLGMPGRGTQLQQAAYPGTNVSIDPASLQSFNQASVQPIDTASLQSRPYMTVDTGFAAPPDTSFAGANTTVDPDLLRTPDVMTYDQGLVSANPATANPGDYLDALGMPDYGARMEQAMAQRYIDSPVATLVADAPAKEAIVEEVVKEPGMLSKMGTWMENNPGLTLAGMYGIGALLPQGGGEDWDDYGDYAYEGDSSWSDRGDAVFMDDDEEFTSRERDYYPRYI